MYYSEIETVRYRSEMHDVEMLEGEKEPVDEVEYKWEELPADVRARIRAAGPLSLEGEYPEKEAEALQETETLIFQGKGKEVKIIARDRCEYEAMHDHVVHRRVGAVFDEFMWLEGADIDIEEEEFIEDGAAEEEEEAKGMERWAPELPPIPDWLEGIEFAKRPCEPEDFLAVLERGDEAAGALRSVIEWVASNGEKIAELPEDYALANHAFLLLGDLRDEKAFPALIRLASLPEEECDRVLGDLITGAMPEVLARTYDGNIELLTGLVENRSAYEFCRRSGLDAIAHLHWDGVLTREWVVEYLRECIKKAEAEGEELLCGKLAGTVGDLEMRELEEPVMGLFAKSLIDPFEMRERDFEDALGGAYRHIRRYVQADEPLWKMQIGAYWLTEKYLKDQTRERRTEVAEEETTGPKDFGLRDYVERGVPYKAERKIGRNEPCPCGSGKKFKKCCGSLAL